MGDKRRNVTQCTMVEGNLSSFFIMMVYECHCLFSVYRGICSILIYYRVILVILNKFPVVTDFNTCEYVEHNVELFTFTAFNKFSYSTMASTVAFLYRVLSEFRNTSVYVNGKIMSTDLTRKVLAPQGG